MVVDFHKRHDVRTGEARDTCKQLHSQIEVIVRIQSQWCNMKAFCPVVNL